MAWKSKFDRETSFKYVMQLLCELFSVFVSLFNLVTLADTRLLFDLNSRMKALFKFKKCLPGYCQMIKLLIAFWQWVLASIEKTLICNFFVVNGCPL